MNVLPPTAGSVKRSRLDHGALVISLDFELHWGVRDRCPPHGSYRANLLGARDAIPRILDLFEEYQIAATWATVGFLFATSREEVEFFSPRIRPQYVNTSLRPYTEPLGSGESDDCLHYAPRLIKAIGERSQQEIATHTFSHYYCLEAGQDCVTFKADLDSAIRIASAWGIKLRSIVFPRNQCNPAYRHILKEAGIVAYRGNQQHWMYAPTTADSHAIMRRGARVADSFVNLAGSHAISWRDVREADGLYNVPASFFLRPLLQRWKGLEGLRLRRITDSINEAARSGKIVHLWWHPHNFGVRIDEHLAMLRILLEAFSRARDEYGMRSLSMAGAAELLAQSQ